jgi:CRP/FNR family transcriptional regulator, nitrogen oxide reductase regulator
MDLTALQKLELFRELDKHAIEAATHAAVLKRTPAGSRLLKQGDQPDHLFCVLEGRFKMTTVSKDGAEKTLRFMDAGDMIGCAAVFKGFPYPATATATTNSVVAAWSGKEFKELMRRHPQISANALAIVGARAEEMLERVREVTTETAERRVAKALMRLLEKSRSEGAANGQLMVSGRELAELSDTTLFTVSRAISAWKKAGIIDGGRGRLAVCDLKQLRSISEGE